MESVINLVIDGTNISPDVIKIAIFQEDNPSIIFNEKTVAKDKANDVVENTLTGLKEKGVSIQVCYVPLWLATQMRATIENIFPNSQIATDYNE